MRSELHNVVADVSIWLRSQFSHFNRPSWRWSESTNVKEQESSDDASSAGTSQVGGWYCTSSDEKNLCHHDCWWCSRRSLVIGRNHHRWLDDARLDSSLSSQHMIRTHIRNKLRCILCTNATQRTPLVTLAKTASQQREGKQTVRRWWPWSRHVTSLRHSQKRTQTHPRLLHFVGLSGAGQHQGLLKWPFLNKKRHSCSFWHNIIRRTTLAAPAYPVILLYDTYRKPCFLPASTRIGVYMC